MEFTASLAADLALLTAARYDPAAIPTSDIAHTIRVFATDLRLAVQSFAGMTITVTQHSEHASDQVVLRIRLLDDQFDAADVETSLRLPVPMDGRDSGGTSVQIVFYATARGAFIDMAADISFLTGSEFSSDDLDKHRGLVDEPNITGVIQAESIVGEAVGVLIAHGHTRNQAYTELDRMAELADTDRITEATAILDGLTNSAPEATD